ncbi:MAG: hypothetical protein ACK56I_20230, partial [bacterium]
EQHVAQRGPGGVAVGRVLGGHREHRDRLVETPGLAQPRREGEGVEAQRGRRCRLGRSRFSGGFRYRKRRGVVVHSTRIIPYSAFRLGHSCWPCHTLNHGTQVRARLHRPESARTGGAHGERTRRHELPRTVGPAGGTKRLGVA